MRLLTARVPWLLASLLKYPAYPLQELVGASLLNQQCMVHVPYRPSDGEVAGGEDIALGELGAGTGTCFRRIVVLFKRFVPGSHDDDATAG